MPRQQSHTADETGREAFTLAVTADAAGQRLDRWLATALPEESRSAIQRWIANERVLVGGKAQKSSYKLETGDVVRVDPPAAPAEASVQAEALQLNVVYEDADLLVIDKAAGMVVHPAPGHSGGTLVNAVLHHAPEIEGVGGERRPGIVHRLDKETSGLIVVAKNDRAHRHLQAQFKARTVYKEYLALLDGWIEPPAGKLVAPIGRHPNDRLRQAVLPADPVTGKARGRNAITEYHTIALYSLALPGLDSAGRAKFSLVRAIIHTGRTHQIRVHFAWRKYPVVGDDLYGLQRPRLPIGRQFLHAHRLRFKLPSTDEEREFVAPLPADLQRVLDHLEASTT